MMTKAKKKHRYKHLEGKPLVEVRVKNPLQLFDARDPAPFRERDLDDDFLEYIVASAKEFSFSTPIKIAIYVEDPESKDLNTSSTREAIQSYLSYRIEIQRGELKAFMRRAQFFLLIGLTILITCISVAQSLLVPSPPGYLGILREGIVIFGWVSIWKPIELILFDWFPLYEKIKLYEKLLKTDINIHFSSL